MIFFLPFVLAEIAAGMIWRFVYDGDYGLVASSARSFGVEPPTCWPTGTYGDAAILASSSGSTSAST